MNALVTVETLTPAVVFAPGGVESIISKLEADVRGMATDISTESGRKAVASLAYKVARSKTALDEMGKDLVSDLKAQSGKIDAERRVIRERLDALRDEVRKPLDDFENAEKDRIAGHETAIAEIVRIGTIDQTDPRSTFVQDRLTELAKLGPRDWQEFAKRAEVATSDTSARLSLALLAAKKREAEQAELERFRQAEIVRDREERDAKIAAEAAEKARVEAEAKAKREAEVIAAKEKAERQRAEQEKADAIARAEKAEADRKAATVKAEKDAREAAEAAERKRLVAVEQERARVAEEKKRADTETSKREADKTHRKRINSEILETLVGLGLNTQQGVAVIMAIVKGEVPHTKISY